MRKRQRQGKAVGSLRCTLRRVFCAWPGLRFLSFAPLARNQWPTNDLKAGKKTRGKQHDLCLVRGRVEQINRCILYTYIYIYISTYRYTCIMLGYNLIVNVCTVTVICTVQWLDPNHFGGRQSQEMFHEFTNIYINNENKNRDLETRKDIENP